MTLRRWDDFEPRGKKILSSQNNRSLLQGGTNKNFPWLFRFKPLGVEEGAHTGQPDGFEMFMVHISRICY